MASLVTIEEAKRRLRIDFPDEDDPISSMLEEATDIVIGYIKTPDHGWTPESAPPRIKSAICMVAARLYQDRDGGAEVLTKAVKDVLERDRDPSLA